MGPLRPIPATKRILKAGATHTEKTGDQRLLPNHQVWTLPHFRRSLFSRPETLLSERRRQHNRHRGQNILETLFRSSIQLQRSWPGPGL